MPRKKDLSKLSPRDQKFVNYFNKQSTSWEKTLDPITNEKAIVFPEAEAIPSKDHPSWPAGIKYDIYLPIPIGPLESMFAMYHWYLFFGRHLVQEEVLELANDVFPHILKSGSWSGPWVEKTVVKPADGCKKVLESLDDESRHHLELRCDRWFKNYSHRNATARKRARWLIGLRGRVELLKVKLPSIGGRKTETWDACIHYGVVNSSKNRDNRPLETQEVAKVLLYHYNDGPGGHPNLGRVVDKFTTRLKDESDEITRELIPLYKKNELIWRDRAQDLVHEWEYEIEGKGPQKLKGRCLEVPSEFRDLLGLEHSHITMDPSYSGWFSNLIQKEQSSSKGQLPDPRFQQSFVQVAPDDPNKLAPLRSENLPQVRPGPERVRDFAGPSTQASGAGSSYQLHDANASSRYREQMQYIPPPQSLSTGYQHSPQSSQYNQRYEATTTGMGNLSVAALAPAPASGQDQGNVKGKKKRHDRSRSPPKEGRHGKRQTGDEARKNLQHQYEQGKKR